LSRLLEETGLHVAVGAVCRKLDRMHRSGELYRWLELVQQLEETPM